jgi:glutamyl-tRNA reductase
VLGAEHSAPPPGSEEFRIIVVTNQRTYVAIGVSHHTAPVWLRERFAVTDDRLPAALEAMRAAPGVDEAVLLCTCNRVEWYLAAQNADAALSAASSFFLARAGNCTAWSDALRVLRGADAVWHVFRVTAGLDSMMVGEAQVLGQVRAAFAAAREAGTVGPSLDVLLRSALAAGRRIRQEAGLGLGQDSVPAAAVACARRQLGPLAGRQVLVVGAGRVAEATVRALMLAGCRRIAVANRTPETARSLAAAVGGEVWRFDRLEDEMRRADIVITSTAAPEAILRVDQVDAATRGRSSPLLLIDLAVPRNVDPRSRTCQGVHLCDIDDLRSAAQTGTAGASRVQRAERLAEAEVASFLRARAARDAASVIAAACADADAIVEGEWQRARVRLASLTDEEEAAVRALVRRVARKILHRPIAMLTEAAGNRAAETGARSAPTVAAPVSDPVAGTDRASVGGTASMMNVTGVSGENRPCIE